MVQEKIGQVLHGTSCVLRIVGNNHVKPGNPRRKINDTKNKTCIFESDKSNTTRFNKIDVVNKEMVIDNRYQKGVMKNEVKK
jgi:hypothetical protein